jgi:hypothetical protein
VADDQDLDNTTALAFSWDFELNAGFGSSVSVSKDTSTPLFDPKHLAGAFTTCTTGTGARRMTLEGVTLGPYKYVARLWNKSGQTLSSTWALKAYPVIGQST